MNRIAEPRKTIADTEKGTQALKEKIFDSLKLIPDICLFGDCDFAPMSLTGDTPDNYCGDCPVRKLYLILTQEETSQGNDCPRCNGEGWVEDPCNHLKILKTCEMCDGVGKPIQETRRRTE